MGGWYPDPAGGGGKRWWDGVQWTNHLQAAPAPVVVQQPQPVQPSQPQQIQPYAQANPYGLPAVQQPYVLHEPGSLSPARMGQPHQASNGAAIGSVVIGALAFCLSLVGLIPGSPIFYYSAGGVLAIIGGIRTLVRMRGYGGARWAPVLAIVLGSLAVIFMVVGIATHVTATASSTSNVTYGSAPAQTPSDDGVGSSSDAQALPAAPSFPADSRLTTYEMSAAQIAKAIYGTYDGGQVSTSGYAGQWPGSLNETTDGAVLFPSGTAAANIPTDEKIRYVLSKDGKYFDIGVSGGDGTEVAIYDSESNQFTWACDTGASSSCPAGGLPPDSGSDSGTGTTTSNS